MMDNQRVSMSVRLSNGKIQMCTKGIDTKYDKNIFSRSEVRVNTNGTMVTSLEKQDKQFIGQNINRLQKYN